MEQVIPAKQVAEVAVLGHGEGSCCRRHGCIEHQVCQGGAGGGGDKGARRQRCVQLCQLGVHQRGQRGVRKAHPLRNLRV